ncbi:MAG: ADP-ribosylation factor-like protein [Candidatus Heimdallarchaeota archaeon]
MSYLFEELQQKDGKPQDEDKILMMGLQQAGKTAIKDVVFFGKKPDEVEGYMATIHYERQFIDKDKKNLVIDSGGQESYWNEAVTQFRHLVFSNVKLLLWIIDVTHPEFFEESERRFSFTIRQFKKENPDGHIAILCHKVDKIQPEELIVLLEQIKKEFDDPKYDIQFESSSIYYADALIELVYKLMKDANMNIQRFELIEDLGKKVEESEEFQSYVMEHQEDPRIRQLMDYLKPEHGGTLPTYGKSTIQLDLRDYDIIEIVLIDKATLSPVIGTSAQAAVNVDKSIDYIVALQEFKSSISEQKFDNGSTVNVVTASNEKVHGMIVSMEKNYLLITSFLPITEDKTKDLYGLITRFSQSLDETERIEEQVISEALPKPKKVVATSAAKAVKAPVIVEEPVVERDGDSLFTFVNKLKEKQVIEEIKEVEPIPPVPEPEKVLAPVPESAALVEPDTEAVLEPDLTAELEEPIEAPVEEVVEAPVEEVVEPPVIVEQPEAESVVEQVVETPQPVKKKKRSKFMERIKEERKRYAIKQIQIQAANLDLSEDDLKNLAEYLKKEKKSKSES